MYISKQGEHTQKQLKWDLYVTFSPAALTNKLIKIE